MREIDKAFLALFKDLKITPNTSCPGTEDKPNYVCYIGKELVGAKEVVRLVKRYQDAIVQMLIEEK